MNPRFQALLTLSTLILLLLFTLTTSHAQDIPTPLTPTLELVGQLGGEINVSAVQGDYAFVGGGPRLLVLDVSDPASPELVAQSDPMTYLIRGIAVAGDYLYVAEADIYDDNNNIPQDNGAVHIFDISNPEALVEVASYDTGGDAHDIWVAGDYAYVAVSRRGLLILDVSDPSDPTEAGFYSAPTIGRHIAVAGNYVYLSENNALSIINASNPATPVKVGSHQLPTAIQSVAVDANRAYVITQSQLYVLNVSNPAAPSQLGSRSISGASFLDLAVAGGVAYVGELTGLYLFDVTLSGAPSQIGFHSTKGDVEGVTLAGNDVYIADGDLHILDVSTPSYPEIIGSFHTLSNVVDIHADGEYLYLAERLGGVGIVDYSNPASPEVVAFAHTPGSAENVDVVQNYLYVASWKSGLHIFDITDPLQPEEIGSSSSPYYAWAVRVVGDYAYVVQAYGVGGLVIMDISDPTAPTQVGFIPTGGWVYGLVVSNSVAYLATGSDLRIIDVSNPASPQYLATYYTQGNPVDVMKQGDTLYVADQEGGVSILDVSNRATPQGVGAYDMAYTQGAAVAGDRLYAADGRYGLHVLDIENPSVPTEKATYDGSSFMHDVILSEDHVLIAGGGQGLLILDYEEIPPLDSTVAGFSAEAADDSVLLRWETTAEMDNAGFRLYRGASANGPETPLTEVLIPSQAPGSSEGFDYEWEDHDVERGATYYYWLDMVDANGVAERFGPVTATVLAPTSVTLGAMASASGALLPGQLALLALTIVGGAILLRRQQGV